MEAASRSAAGAGAFPARLAQRVATGSTVLFDLDDTLVVATEASRAQPLFHSHSGYATVVHAAGSTMFVAVRPFTLAAIASLCAAGFRVGFWSAGTPPYVSAIAERLIDAVRHMQVLKHAKRSSRRAPGSPAPAPPQLFVPVAVVALDQQNLRWMRDTYLESERALSGGGNPAGARYRTLLPGRVDAGLGTVIKEPGKLAPRHPNLASAGPRVLLVDNLRHDPDWTLEVRDFLPGGPGASGRTEALDRVLIDVARAILSTASGR
jgi:hypothetical protein